MMRRPVAPGMVPWLGAALLAALLCIAQPLAAQDPVPPDTTGEPADTAVFVVPPEILPADTIPGVRDTTTADSLRPAPVFPVFPQPGTPGWAEARWVWDREELLRFHGLSVLDLLRQIPGLALFRGGVPGQPVGVGTFGLGGGRLRVFLDGYELDPIASSIVDLQRLALVDLEEMRLERGLAETRVELLTFRLDDSRPFSQVEAGTGSDQTRLLRGIFSRPIGGRNILTLGLDLVDTEGLPAREPFAVTTGVVRWSYLFAPNAGVQLEYRQAGVSREREAFVEEGSFRDVILRGRARPRPGLAVDGIVGRSWRSPDDADSVGIETAQTQTALRALYERGSGWLEGAARFRFGEQGGYPAPGVDLTLRSGIRPFPLLALHAEARYADTDTIAGTEIAGTARLGPWNGFSAFGTVATGTRGLALLRDTTYEFTPPDEQPRDTTVTLASAAESSLDGARVGAEWSGRGVFLGAALVSLNASRAVPFGFPFDTGVAPVDPERVTAFEAYASAPLYFPELRIEGSFFRPTGTVSQPYLRADEGRLALTFHQLAYEGNREITLRLEGLRRGSAVVPQTQDLTFGATSEPYTLFNLYLQIRVIDVRAFLIWENLTSIQPADLPGRPFPGQRTLYGVRWHFRN